LPFAFLFIVLRDLILHIYGKMRYMNE
jgi:hypothetical protein